MSGIIPPQMFDWDGEAMVPQRPGLADRHYVVGETYRLGVVEERSANSHNHYFACVHDAWANLPEDKTNNFPTPEHLRKWALIKAGYRDERTLVAKSRAEALRLASFIKPMDEFAVVVVKDATVTVYTAKSQSARAMNKKEFQESKESVLGILSQMIGVKPDDLKRNAGMAA